MRIQSLSSRFDLCVGIFVTLILILAAGCGPKSDRLAVSGEVTFNGKPLSGGSIRFASTGGEKLSSAGAMVENGRYNIPQPKGLLPGLYRVEITAPDNEAPPIIYRSGPGDPGFLTAPDRIPPDYNVSSKLQVEVSADGGNHFPFEIVTPPKK